MDTIKNKSLSTDICIPYYQWDAKLLAKGLTPPLSTAIDYRIPCKQYKDFCDNQNAVVQCLDASDNVKGIYCGPAGSKYDQKLAVIGSESRCAMGFNCPIEYTKCWLL